MRSPRKGPLNGCLYVCVIVHVFGLVKHVVIVLGFVLSIPNPDIGLGKRHHVEWDVKPQLNQPHKHISFILCFLCCEKPPLLSTISACGCDSCRTRIMTYIVCMNIIRAGWKLSLPLCHKKNWIKT